jgi:hypothetical protein
MLLQSGSLAKAKQMQQANCNTNAMPSAEAAIGERLQTKLLLCVVLCASRAWRLALCCG